jgi:type II secretory pathway predicted ATPase ExeA/outer membrane protein OmpA-like peptidoglycan-associated protein
VRRHAPDNSLTTQLFLHFGLRGNPFGVTPDPRFLCPTRTHREALASLINGIECGFGFQMLIAQPGMGKTSLLFNLLDRYRNIAQTAFLFQPQREPHELLQSVLHELGTNSEETSIRKLSEQLNQVLCDAAHSRRRVIVVVDEAQNLDFVVLEALRQLSNFETSHSKLMQIILSGQPQLAEKLATPQQEQLRQRISSIARISPLALDETQTYINHRLATAGYTGAELFSTGAIRMIWNRGKGVPRNINTLCFSSMMLAFAEHATLIDERFLQEAERDLDLKSVLADIYESEPRESSFPDNFKVLPMPDPSPHSINSRFDGSEDVFALSSVSDAEETDILGIEKNSPSPVKAAPQSAPIVVQTAVPQAARPVLSPVKAAKLDVAPIANVEQPVAKPVVVASASVANSASQASSQKKEIAVAERRTAPETKAAEPAPVPKSDQIPATKTVLAEVPSTPPQGGNAKKRVTRSGVWSTFLTAAGLAGILALLLSGRVTWPHSTRVEAQTAQPAPVRNVPVEAYSPTGEAALPEQESPAANNNPAPPASDSTVPDLKSVAAAKSNDVVTRTYSTDLDIAEEKSDHTQELKRIYFEQDSDAIADQYRPWLQQLADMLIQESNLSVTLEGHTDGLGEEAYNMELSSRRAIAVRNALVNELHVSKERIAVTGAGSADPLQPNSNSAGRAYNRRVEVRLSRPTNN